MLYGTRRGSRPALLPASPSSTDTLEIVAAHSGVDTATSIPAAEFPNQPIM